MTKRDNANYDVFWDRQTKKYGITRYEKFIIHEILKRNPRKVFEVGIGNGFPIGIALYQKSGGGVDVQGCDISVKLVSAAKKNLGKQSDDTCIFAGEVDEYHGCEKYDVIYCVRTSWCITDFENTIKKMISMTENGYVIFDIMQKESLYYVKQACLYAKWKMLRFLGVYLEEHMKLFFYSRYKIERLLKDNSISFHSYSETEITKSKDYWNTPKRFYVCRIKEKKE